MTGLRILMAVVGMAYGAIAYLEVSGRRKDRQALEANQAEAGKQPPVLLEIHVLDDDSTYTVEARAEASVYGVKSAEEVARELADEAARDGLIADSHIRIPAHRIRKIYMRYKENQND